MTKSKSEQKREAIQKADKMARPGRSVRPFNFPAHGITVHAVGPREAEKQLESALKSKSKSDD